MICLKQYREIIKATDETIWEIVRGEIEKLGWDADLNHIDVSEVTDMIGLFNSSLETISRFNGDISNWNVSNVEDMRFMFAHSKFNGDISNWNVGNVIDMNRMFSNSPFNGDISGWNVGNVIIMNHMFSNSPFNGDISQWNVGNVINMYGMFYSSPFNGDISGWNVRNVIYMNNFFYRSQFNGDISGWDVQNVEDMSCMFHISPLEEREPWWYSLSPLFGSPHLMLDSFDFRWIDLEEKIIYREKLSRILRRSYNTKWNGELPEVHNFTYN